jgi:hypothetical protein
MRTIKFSHKYYKMPEDVTNASLIQVFLCDRKDLSSDFIAYDTGYENEYGDYNEYNLPKGKVMVLLLRSNTGKERLWTTIRRWTPRKEEYYKSMVGEEFEISII